jgi:hypothetical protein
MIRDGAVGLLLVLMAATIHRMGTLVTVIARITFKIAIYLLCQ